MKRLLIAVLTCGAVTANAAQFSTNGWGTVFVHTNGVSLSPSNEVLSAIRGIVTNTPGWGGTGGTNTPTLQAVANAGNTATNMGAVTMVGDLTMGTNTVIGQRFGEGAGIAASGTRIGAYGFNAGGGAQGDYWGAYGDEVGINAVHTNSHSFGRFAGMTARGNNRMYLDVYGSSPNNGADGATNDTIFMDSDGKLYLGGGAARAENPSAGGVLRGTWLYNGAEIGTGSTNGGITAATATNIAETVLAAHTGLTARAGHDGLGLTGADIVAAGGLTNEPLWEAVSNSIATNIAARWIPGTAGDGALLSNVTSTAYATNVLGDNRWTTTAISGNLVSIVPTPLASNVLESGWVEVLRYEPAGAFTQTLSNGAWVLPTKCTNVVVNTLGMDAGTANASFFWKTNGTYKIETSYYASIGNAAYAVLCGLLTDSVVSFRFTTQLNTHMSCSSHIFPLTLQPLAANGVTNSFAWYATAAGLTVQGTPIFPCYFSIWRAER